MYFKKSRWRDCSGANNKIKHMSSRLINSKIKIPSDISAIRSGNFLNLKSNNYSAQVFIDGSVDFKIEDGMFSLVNMPSDISSGNFKSKAGTVISLINAAISDLTNGFKVTLKLNGVGFKASVQDKQLILFLGYSHDIVVSIPTNITISISEQIYVNISGYSRSDISRFARFVSNLRKRDPYKDKGVHFPGDFVLRKVGKKA